MRKFSSLFARSHHTVVLSILITLTCLLNAFSVTGCASGTDTTGSSETACAKFDSLTNQYFHDELAYDTVSLHYTVTDPASLGIDDYAITLGSFAPDANISQDPADNSAHELSYYISALEKINRNALPADKQIDYDVLNDYLATQSKLSSFEYYSDPLSASNGLQSELPVLLAEYDFRSENDINEYLTLLKDFPRYFDELAEYEQAKSDHGLFMSDELCNEVIGQCEAFISDPNKNILITTFNSRIDDYFSSGDPESKHKINDYKSANQEAVTEYVIPAYKKLIGSLTSLLGSGRNSLGLSYYDDGSDYYELLVYATTGCDDSVDDIYDSIADQRISDLKTCGELLQADPRIVDKCADVSACMPDASDITDNTAVQDDTISDIPDNKTVQNDTASDIPDTMLQTLCQAIEDDFPKISNTSYSVSYVDKSLQDSLAPAFYLTAPVDDPDCNKIYINPASDYSQIGLFTTLAHEGFPGHLYQTVKSYEYGLSPFRTLLNYGGYTEGWATYVEMMSYKYAGLDENVSAFLQANHDFSLSLYATSDIGIHYYGWDFDELTDFWEDYGIKDEASIREIQSLILASPTNYLKYYVGYLQFLELKDEQMKLLGDDFSEKDFHESILRTGPAPFSLLRQYN